MLMLGCFIMFALLAMKPTQIRNLKVLPTDISDEKLDSLMETYAKGLGVTCDFCHVKKEDGKIDFSLDDNPAKDVARGMLRLTIEINKKYFNYDSLIHPAYLTRISCYTCHKGNAYPEE